MHGLHGVHGRFFLCSTLGAYRLSSAYRQCLCFAPTALPCSSASQHCSIPHPAVLSVQLVLSRTHTHTHTHKYNVSSPGCQPGSMQRFRLCDPAQFNAILARRRCGTHTLCSGGSVAPQRPRPILTFVTLWHHCPRFEHRGRTVCLCSEDRRHEFTTRFPPSATP